MTDLCWECQRNNRDISTSSNLPEVVKQAKLKKQQAHLDLVFMERTFYQNMVMDAKAAYTAAGCPPLGPHPHCTTDFAVHLSFDFAQQVHLPSFPMQPGLPVPFGPQEGGHLWSVHGGHPPAGQLPH